MSLFQQPLPNCRLAQTHWNDDLPSVAARELGDANRWPDLVWVNNLVPPYIVNLDAQVRPGVIKAGSLIKVPAPAGFATEPQQANDVYGRDCEMQAKMLAADADGDLAVLSGVDNLRQQLEHAITTPTGQASRHPDYGCMVWLLQGQVNGPIAAMLGQGYVSATLAADYRVSSVESATAEADGDVLRISARAVAIEGAVVDVAVK